MKLLLSTLLSIGLIGLSTSGFADKAKDPSVVILSANEPQFTIQLPSNPTTGYQWYVTQYDHQLLQLVNYHFQPGNPKLMGAPGVAIFVFTANPSMFAAPQQTSVQLTYSRAWETAPGQTKTVVVSSIPGTPAQPAVTKKSDTVSDKVQNADMMIPVKS